MRGAVTTSMVFRFRLLRRGKEPMKLPLEISSKNVHLSDEMEELIREKAAKLDNIYDQIIGCRIMVDIPHRSQRSGMHYNVRIDITLPGGEIVVKREPDEDLYAAISNSFEVAQRRLKDHAGKQRGEVKYHEEKPVARISKLFHEEGYGFLQTPEGKEVYFHENALITGRFKDLEIGTPVSYIEQAGEKGPQASSVYLA
jgi:ribosomal subunit interface protein